VSGSSILVRLEIQRISDIISTARYEITTARQILTDARAAVTKLQSNSPSAHATYSALSNLDNQIAEDLRTISEAHRHLENLRLEV
jgi:predicted  nucleic acid-binding Zn-ribbon protein